MKVVLSGFVSLLTVFISVDSHASSSDLLTVINDTRTTCGKFFEDIISGQNAATAAVGLGAIATGTNALGTVVGGVATAAESDYEKKKQKRDLINDAKKSNGQSGASVQNTGAYVQDYEHDGEGYFYDETVLEFGLNQDKDAVTYSKEGLRNANRDLEAARNKMNKLTNAQLGAGVAGFFANAFAAWAGGSVGFDKLISGMGSCMDSVSKISSAQIQYRLETGADETDALYAQATKIIETCGQYDLADVQKLRGYSTASAIVSAVGAVGSVTAGALAGAAGSKLDASAPGLKKDVDADKYGKNMLVAGTAVSGVATAASATGVALNAIQLKAVQELADITSGCAGALDYEFGTTNQE